MVYGQLLPDGFERIAPCDHLWSEEGRGVDDRLDRTRISRHSEVATMAGGPASLPGEVAGSCKNGQGI